MANIMAFSYDSRPIQTIMNQVKNSNKRDGIDLQPPYQRGFIWGTDFIDKLMLSIIKGYPIGNISLRVRADKNSKGAMQEVVDGQQRLTSIRDFANDEHSVQGETARNIIKYICEYMGTDTDAKVTRLKKRLSNKGRISLKFSHLPDTIKENFNSFNISITNITNSSDDEISEYFKYLQNHERLRAGEMIKSIPSTGLESYLDRIVDKNKLLRILGFPNDRRQFDRAFYSVLGLLEGVVGFGALDKEVIKYATDFTSLKPEAEQRCNTLIEKINFITSLVIPHNLVRSNVRFMKFFLLTASLGFIDYHVDAVRSLVALDAINKKLSAFSSAKAQEVERVFDGYSKEVIEEHRLLALISKGGHTLRRAENRMRILAYYANDFQNKTIPSGIIPE